MDGWMDGCVCGWMCVRMDATCSRTVTVIFPNILNYKCLMEFTNFTGRM